MGYLSSSLALTDPLRFVTGVRPDQWKQILDELVTRLDEYSNALIKNAQKFLEIGDTRGAEIIQSSCVGCLTYLAVLCDLVSQLNPNCKPQMDTICDSALERLGCVTKGMGFDEYSYLDLLLRVRRGVDHSRQRTKLIMSLIRFRGKGPWPRLIHGSVIYRLRRVHPCSTIGKSLQRRCWTLRPGSQEIIPQNSVRPCCSSMVDKRDRSIQTFCWLRRD